MGSFLAQHYGRKDIMSAPELMSIVVVVIMIAIHIHAMSIAKEEERTRKIMLGNLHKASNLSGVSESVINRIKSSVDYLKSENSRVAIENTPGAMAILSLLNLEVVKHGPSIYAMQGYEMLVSTIADKQLD